ncbi:MAG: Cna B-type domain-containing protein [Clostridia bacterium]|nr:Cna B-type domain-containing protein [Clostridia bacterium]
MVKSKGWLRKILALVLCLALMGSTFTALAEYAEAADADDPQKSEIDVTLNSDAKPPHNGNQNITLFRVARPAVPNPDTNVILKNEWEMVAPFKKVSYLDAVLAEDLEKVLEDAWSIARENLGRKVTELHTDESGQVVFSELAAGVYYGILTDDLNSEESEYPYAGWDVTASGDCEVIRVDDLSEGRFMMQPFMVAVSRNGQISISPKVRDYEGPVPMIELSGTKTWDDDGNAASYRPESITLQLLQNGEVCEGVEPVWTDTDKDVWTYTFSDLPRWDAEGIDYIYTVKEEPIRRFGLELYTVSEETTEDAINLTNTLRDMTSVAGTKTWDDSDNVGNFRPETIELTLLADGEPLEDAPQPVWNKGEGNVWSYSFNYVPEKDDEGNVIVYTVQEALVENYQPTTSEDTLQIVNHLVPPDSQISLSGTKTWVDSEDAAGFRPDTITLTLYQNGVPSQYPVIWDSADGDVWSYHFEKLPEYKPDGTKHVYTVVETYVPNYETTYSEDTLDITNTVVPPTDLSGTKTWHDENNNGEFRPPFIQVSLLADGVVVQTLTVRGGPTAESWDYEFTGLPTLNAAGNEIVYTVEETVPQGYRAEYNGMDIDNYVVPTGVLTSVSGSKTWDDENNAHEVRPGRIEVTLYADGVPTAYRPTWNIGEGNVWTYTFRNLPAYHADMTPVVYTVQEAPVEHYETEYSEDGMSIINHLQPPDIEYFDLSGTKTWNDSDNLAGNRPVTIQVHVYLVQDEEIVASATVSEADGWAYTFEHLPVDDGYGHHYQYLILEDPVEGYVMDRVGYDLINRMITPPENPEEPPEEPPVTTRENPPDFFNPSFGSPDELFELLDYDTPLWGGLLGTGDETPAYPYIFGGAGLLIVALLLILGKKREKKTAK